MLELWLVNKDNSEYTCDSGTLYQDMSYFHHPCLPVYVIKTFKKIVLTNY